MITTKYPNRDILYAAYTIYRDAMRSFIIRYLDKHPNKTPEELCLNALPNGTSNRPSEVVIKLQNGSKTAEVIDIGDFEHIIIGYWTDTVSFSAEFDPDSNIRTHMETVRKARKLWAHPGLEDADPQETQTLLSLISKVLGEINEPEEKRKVEVICNQLFPYDSESNIEKVQEELTTLKKQQEATDERLAAVEEHCTNIADTLNQLRTALVKPLESKEQFINDSNQLTEIERLADEKPTTSHSSLESSLQNSAEISNPLEVGQHLIVNVKTITDKSVFVTLDKG